MKGADCSLASFVRPSLLSLIRSRHPDDEPDEAESGDGERSAAERSEDREEAEDEVGS